MKYNLIVENLTRFTHDYTEKISKEYFNSTYGFPAVPVLFKKAFQELSLKKKWTQERLIENIVEKELVESVNNRKPELMSLRDFFAAKENRYYFKTSQHIISELNKDVKMPELFNCWYANTKMGIPRNRLSWLYVGQNETHTELHRDLWGTSAWNYLIKGTKIWLVYPQSFNTEIKNNFSEYEVSRTLQDPNRLLDQKIKPLIAIQKEGDLVYMPGQNYHAVINLDETISLTENFINEINYDEVRSYFKKRNNKKNIASIEAIIKEGFEYLK